VPDVQNTISHWRIGRRAAGPEDIASPASPT
jgi:hypothetical protein